ncbi:hypothetical protein FSP39_021679 [Pinctada imbricata]|uniref:Cadherin domain-containing protein n=1 Tax=Pinctada imbricata TaxID=66713 RepID=A0AA88Y8V8_PINIB|nr:hypothetical protein FSP39_021679 [Pinctada imbricata]
METFLKGFLLLSAIILTLSSTASGQLTQLRFSILEEQSPFTYVGNVAEASNIQANRSQNEIARLRYQILTQVNPNTALFVINQFTGRLESAVVLDREDLCQSSPQCILGIDVAVFMQDEANPTQLTDLIVAFQVNVELRDMNDNSPTFPEQTITVEFPESSSIGFEVLTSTARDDDGGDLNSVQTYEFLNSDDTFDLQVLRNTDGSEFLAIVLNKTLDRELKEDYQLTIVARDGGNPSRTGSVNVNILVGDANDNRPVFLRNPYNVTFPENQPVGSVILTVSAIDSDDGQNAHITYKFGSSSRSQLFLINSTSGEISLRSALDYEISQQREFSIVVEAEDGGDPLMASQVLVNVKLYDVNDNAPQININLPPGGVDVSEDADSGYYIANVFVYDIDSGENGTVTCSVENEKFTLVKFSKDIYKINLQSSLDREQAEKHNVTVVCSDEGVPRMTNRTFFTINVKDVNDNFPVFSQTRYNVSIEENNSIGDVVSTISAHDNDAGENGRVTYRLLDRTDYFSINPGSGIITANVVFDRENITSVFLRVIASDNGDDSARFTSTANVTVFISDENDETPQFHSDSYIFNVLENQPLSTVIGNVSAYDKDVGANGDFTFSIEDGFTRFFEIDNDGKVRARLSLDRESRQEYSFEIFVTDKGVRKDLDPRLSPCTLRTRTIMFP